MPTPVTILLFASFAEATGRPRIPAELPDGATVADAWAHAQQLAPGLARWARPPLVAKNREYAKIDEPLAAGDEVAFLPPIAGG